MSRHYLGAAAFYTSYDALLKRKYYYGDAVAAGVTYGYAVVMNKHWNFEASVGIGALRYRQYKYPNKNLDLYLSMIGDGRLSL